MIALWSAVFWKSGIALGAALAINRCLHNRSADLRRLVLSTAVVVLIVAAAAVPVLPHWSAVLPAWLGRQKPSHPSVVHVSARPIGSVGKSHFTSLILHPPNAQHSIEPVDITPWLVSFLWSLGAAILLFRFAIQLRGLGRLREASEPVSESNLLAEVVCGRRRVDLRQSEGISAPVTWGIVWPVILLPAGFEQLPEEYRNAVLCHEMAHIQAGDFLMRALTELIGALIWFQPLIWIVRRKLRDEQEIACDNRVLAAGGRASAYAKLLMDWEERPGGHVMVAVGITNQSCLKRRLYSLLDPGLHRESVSLVGIVGTCFLGLATILPLVAVSVAQDQPLAASLPAFEVVSVRPCNVEPGRGSGAGPLGAGASNRISTGCTALVDENYLGLIQRAYVRYQGGQLHIAGIIPIRGGPAWIHSGHYEINAKSESPERQAVLNGPMLQAVLEDRFKLKIHRETKEGPVYALTEAKGGSKLKPFTEGSCLAMPLAPVPAMTKGQRYCRYMVSFGGSVDAEGSTLGEFSKLLNLALDRPAIDKTALTGRFDIRLVFAADEGAPGILRNGPGPSAPPTSDSGSPGIFTAIQEQLGLKLVASKGPVEILVIDHVERPRQN
jgi:bla regulator protein blaR1